MSTKPPNVSNISVLIISYQSCRNKIPELCILINPTDPDIIMGNRTWLKSNIISAEIVPPSSNVNAMKIVSYPRKFI